MDKVSEHYSGGCVASMWVEILELSLFTGARKVDMYV